MSNLLDKASIILTPTAYNNGEALCVKPSDGSGDFDFSRNSAATRVNAQGLVENVQILSSNLVQNGDFSEEGAEEVSNGSFSQEGSELVTNGSFDTDSNWTKLTGWTISGGSANCALGGSDIFQSKPAGFWNGKTLKVTYTISNYVQGEVKPAFWNPGITEGTFVSANGTYTEYISPTTNAGQFGFRTNSGNFIGSIDNVSVREVGQDWTLGTGWSIAEDKAVKSGTDLSYLTQSSLSSVVGKTYRVKASISNMTTGNIRIDNFTDGTVYTSDVEIDVYYTATSVGNFRFLGWNGFNGSITNISVKEVGQNWSLGTGFSIGENVAIYDDSANGNLSQSKTFTSGKKYNISFEIKSGSGSIAFLSSNGVTTYVGYATYGIGTHSVVFDYTTGSGFGVFASSFLGGAFSITNISIIEISTDTSLPRINYEGFSYQDALGSELIVNGTFDSDTAWNKQTGWIIQNGYATQNGSGSFQKISQLIDTENGKIYKIKVSHVLNGVSLSIRARDTQPSGTVLSNLDVSTDGISELTFTAISNKTAIVFQNGNANIIQEIDNVSVKEYLGQEVVPDSGCGSWLFEPQSTNLITQSELFSDATWTKVGGGAADDTIITDNYATSPDGTNNASRAQFNAVGTANGDRANLYANINVTSGETFTMSFYGKSATATDEEVVLRMGSVQQVSVTLTQEYQRFSHTYTVTSSGAKNFGIQIRGNSAVTTADIIIWGFQVEAQSYATSMIPTSGSSVTRNQDVCNNGGSLASINSTEGVLYAEIAALANDGTNRAIAISDGSTSNVVRFYYSTTDNRIVGNVKSGGTTYFNFNNVLVSATDFLKVAVSYKINEFKMYVNGTLVFTDTSGNTPIGLNELAFDNGAGNDKFYGKTKALAVWKEALSDAELTELTTI